MNYFNKTTIIIGTSESKGIKVFDTQLIIKAKLMLDICNFNLRLDFTKYQISVDNVISNKEYLSSYNVGTFFKPKKRFINTLLRENVLKPYTYNGWSTDEYCGITLTELFIDINENIFIKRILKLNKIKKSLSKKTH